MTDDRTAAVCVRQAKKRRLFLVFCMCFKRFYPTEYYSSAYVIDFENLYRQGYKGLLTDVDNTLVPHDAPADERALKLISDLKRMGWRICIISNNDEPRVKPFADLTDCPYVYKAGKPSARGYLDGMRIIKTEKKETVFLGDQLFTDIWGANNAGIRSMLVQPMARDPKRSIRLKRAGEAVVKCLCRKHFRVVK